MPAASIDLDKAMDLTRTGDVWLFRGYTAADRAIQVTTNSPVNHVGMSVVLDDMPPLMWHAELGKSLPDLWTGTRQRGVQLHDLRDAVTVWATKYGQRAWLRQLEPPVTREMEDAVLRTIARLDGTPFPSTARLASRWLRGRVAGRSGARPREHQLETAYCAEVRGGHLPGHGAAAGRHPELVRPRPVLERRRPRPVRRLPARRRDRRAHPGQLRNGGVSMRAACAAAAVRARRAAGRRVRGGRGTAAAVGGVLRRVRRPRHRASRHRHLAATACRGLTRAQVNLAVGQALYAMTSNVHGKAERRARVRELSPLLGRLVTTVPAQRSPPPRPPRGAARPAARYSASPPSSHG